MRASSIDTATSSCNCGDDPSASARSRINSRRATRVSYAGWDNEVRADREWPMRGLSRIETTFVCATSIYSAWTGDLAVRVLFGDHSLNWWTDGPAADVWQRRRPLCAESARKPSRVARRVFHQMDRPPGAQSPG